MSSSSSGIVAGLTGAAMAAVAFLAYQASANVPDSFASPGPSASADSSHTSDKPANAQALPPHSGTGARLVYSLVQRRVWLVNGVKAKTFTVMPSAVGPKPGSYQVLSRSGSVIGSDGVPVEHVVRFASVDGVTVGFSAARDNSTASPDPKFRTGGIRMKRADGDLVWAFATIGAKVVVIP